MGQRCSITLSAAFVHLALARGEELLERIRVHADFLRAGEQPRNGHGFSGVAVRGDSPDSTRSSLTISVTMA